MDEISICTNFVLIYSCIGLQEVSVQPQCILDLCFWLPEDDTSYQSGDFYELCRNIGGDIVEQVGIERLIQTERIFSQI